MLGDVLIENVKSAVVVILNMCFADNLYVQIDADGLYVACPYESLGNDSILNSSNVFFERRVRPVRN